MLESFKIRSAPLITAENDSPHLIAPSEIARLDRFALERRVRSLCQNAYLGNNTVLCRVLGRYKIYVDTTDIGFGAHLLMDGIWEPWITQYFAREVQAGMRVLDIGANLGYYSVLFGDLAGPSGRVAAFEPNPRAVQLVQWSLAVNGLDGIVRVIPQGVGAASGDMLFYIPPHEPKNARIIHEEEAAALEPNVSRIGVVAVDQVVADWDRVDFIKIDVEGAEEAAMTGLIQTMTRFRPQIVLEFNPGRCAAPADLIARLRAVYPVIARLEVEGVVDDVSDTDLLSLTRQEDQMLILKSDY